MNTEEQKNIMFENVEKNESIDKNETNDFSKQYNTVL